MASSRSFVVALCACASFSSAVAAATRAVPAPRDTPYPGPLVLEVTATDREHRVFHVKETLPVRPGPLVLLYPAWIPGAHAPTNQIKRIAGIAITANGRPLAWTRDEVDLQALHVDVPAGTTSLDIRFDHLLPKASTGDESVITDTIVHVKWEGLVLYPAGYYASRIEVDPSLVLPDGFAQASALRAQGPTTANRVRFERVSLETLIDSPVMGGRHVRRVPLDPDGAPRPVVLDVFADEPKALEIPTIALDAHRAMVQQLDRLFGSRHFRHYDALVALSDSDLGIGLEHHESQEMAMKADYFVDWSASVPDRYLIPHEFVHSWNGKFRRPKDLWTPNFNVPMRNGLLWVYEGGTQYWGDVIAARSGLMSIEIVKSIFAQYATTGTAPGRRWRNLQDTTFDEIVQGREIPLDWQEYSRSGSDYYVEGALLWLGIDAIIREKSGGARSLDDFARAFFGVEDGRVAPLTYDFDDVVAALARVQPYDWTTYLRARLDRVDTVPGEAIERTGWRLAWTDREPEFAKLLAARGDGRAGFRWSLGFSIRKDGEIVNTRWEGPAFRAGLSNGMTLVAVGMREYSPEVLRAEIAAAKGREAPIDLLVKDGKTYKVAHVDYHDGIRYPTLERIEGRPDLLTPILTAR